MDERVYDPVFASNAGYKGCLACDKAAPNKCQFHQWVDRKVAQYERIRKEGPMVPQAEWISPALIGLLRQLPPYNQAFAPGQKEKWLKAFEAILEHDYPIKQPSSAEAEHE